MRAAPSDMIAYQEPDSYRETVVEGVTIPSMSVRDEAMTGDRDAPPNRARQVRVRRCVERNRKLL